VFKHIIPVNGAADVFLLLNLLASAKCPVGNYLRDAGQEYQKRLNQQAHALA